MGLAMEAESCRGQRVTGGGTAWCPVPHIIFLSIYHTTYIHTNKQTSRFLTSCRGPVRLWHHTTGCHYIMLLSNQVQCALRAPKSYLPEWLFSLLQHTRQMEEKTHGWDNLSLLTGNTLWQLSMREPKHIPTQKVYVQLLSTNTKLIWHSTSAPDITMLGVTHKVKGTETAMLCPATLSQHFPSFQKLYSLRATLPPSTLIHLPSILTKY